MIGVGCSITGGFSFCAGLAGYGGGQADRRGKTGAVVMGVSQAEARR